MVRSFALVTGLVNLLVIIGGGRRAGNVKSAEGSLGRADESMTAAIKKFQGANIMNRIRKRGETT